MPANLAPTWMRDAARLDPVNWAVEAGRQTLVPRVEWMLVATRVAYLVAFAVSRAWLSARAFRTCQRFV